MRIRKQKKKAFTLIELMLALAFLGTLLLSVAMLAMRLVNMYTKGSTMRAVNSVGSAIMDDVRSHVAESNLWTENLKDNRKDSDHNEATYYKIHTYKVDPDTIYEKTYVDYGAFCTNSYTYVFNYQAAMLRYREGKPHTESGEQNYLMVGTSSKQRPYALIRIKDTGCAQFKLLGMATEDIENYNKKLKEDSPNKLPDYDSNYYMQGNEHYFKVISLKDKDVTILLDGTRSDENSDLQLYDFSVMSGVQSKASNQALYDIAFVLGTTRGGIDVKSTNNYCSNNSKASGNEDMSSYGLSYCSVNRFEFVVLQTGEK